MAEFRPVMCTLAAADLRDREQAWRKLLDGGLIERTEVLGGIRLSAEPGAVVALLDLVELERECCAWIDYRVEDAAVTLTAEGEGAAVLAGMFA